MARPKLLLPFAFSVAILLAGASSTTFIFQNDCPFSVWPASVATAGRDQLPTTGFRLLMGSSRSVAAPSGWSGRMWARHWCDVRGVTGAFSCFSGDCGTGEIECGGRGPTPPVTFVDFALHGDGGKDSYNVSCVDGFNVPVAVTPWGFGGGGCGGAACPQPLNLYCPEELRATLPSNGTVVGCKSACVAFNRDDYCSRGKYGSPETCRRTNYSEVFKGRCPQAISYPFDDVGTTFTCAGAENYLVTFCPITLKLA